VAALPLIGLVLSPALHAAGIIGGGLLGAAE
jgi:hypothetical protein